MQRDRADKKQALYHLSRAGQRVFHAGERDRTLNGAVQGAIPVQRVFKRSGEVEGWDIILIGINFAAKQQETSNGADSL